MAPQSLTDLAMSERVEAIVQEFLDLDDQVARYRHLVAMGEAMPRIPTRERREEDYIPGCVYDIWIQAEHDPARGVLHFRADSDAKITRGLAALILRVLDGQPPRAVAEADLAFLDRIGLRSHLSAQRSNGLAAMIEQIRGRAREHLNLEHNE
jgi:cysteine desulfuration protein SufE